LRGLLSREGVVGRALRITLLGFLFRVGVFSFAGAGIGVDPAFEWDCPPYRISGVFKERSELFSVDDPYSVQLSFPSGGLTAPFRLNSN
jgi:hypothetical protein